MADTTNEREVNPDTEVLNLEDDVETPAEEPDEDLDEQVIPPVDEEEETPSTETEETPAEPEGAPESSPEGTDPAPEEPEPAPSQPAPVPGETPREKALRLEVTRVKGLLRKQGIHQLIAPEGDAPAAPAAVTERLSKLKETYSDEEIAAMGEAVDAIAESRGYVKKSESYQETVNSLVEGFIEAHPEYKPENDPEDVRWTRFQETLASGIYSIQGKNAKQLQTIFEKVHEDVVKELGSPTVEVKNRQVAAQRHKIQSVSHSGGTKTPAEPKTPTIDPSVRNMFKDFDDDDLKED